jgi:uncharacterized membrane protein
MELNESKKEAKEGELLREPDERRRLLAALSYVGVLFFLPVLLGEKDAFVRHHVRQGAVVCLFELATALFGWIPLIGWSFAVAVFAVAVIAFIRAWDGKKWEIPYVHEWSRKINL